MYSQRYSEYSLLHLRIDGSVYRAERSEQRRVHEAHHDAAVTDNDRLTQQRTAFRFRKHRSISAAPTGIAATQRIRVGCNCLSAVMYCAHFDRHAQLGGLPLVHAQRCELRRAQQLLVPASAAQRSTHCDSTPTVCAHRQQRTAIALH